MMFRAYSVSLVPVIVLAALGSGSGCDTADEEIVLSHDDTARITDVTATVNETVYAAVSVTWSTEDYGESWVEYGLDGELTLATPRNHVDLEHDLLMLGLKMGRTYSYKAVTDLGNGTLLESEIQTVDIPNVPAGLSQLTVTEWTPEKTTGDGFMLFSMMGLGPPAAVITDRDGDIVWIAQTSPGLSQFTVRPGVDKRSVVWSQYDDEQVTDVGGIFKISLDGNESILTRSELAHHDFAELPDGHDSWIAYEFGDYPIGPEVLPFVSDRILTAHEGATDNTQPQELFSFFNDYPRDPWLICDHTERIDDLGEWGDYYHWTHSNSLMYQPHDDTLVVLAKFMDVLLKLDRQTGEIIWQLGGQYSDFELDTPEDHWVHGHMSHVWDGGFMMFNNNSHTDPDPTVSSAIEYSWDETTMTFQKEWEYADPDGRYVEFLGDARKLPNGNYLISWTTAGMITEITPEYEVVWSAVADLGTALTRITYIDDIYDFKSAEPLIR